VRLIRTVDPAVAPVTLDEAKLFLRVDHTDEDLAIGDLVSAATTMVEAYAGVSLIDQTWRVDLDQRPVARWLRLPRGTPNPAVTSIVAHLDDGTDVTMDAGDYLVSVDGTVTLAVGASWPSGTLRAADGLAVTYTAGYGPDPVDVPEAIRRAVLAVTADLYEHRDVPSGGYPRSAAWLLDPYRVFV